MAPLHQRNGLAIAAVPMPHSGRSWLLLGRNELALRFPEILGIILFSWCMYFFVAKRLGALFGLSAMILPLVTQLEFYAGEARPYGLLLGFCGLALLAWRNAVESPQRRVALPLFATTLALLVATHAYAIFTVSMFAAAETARCLKNRRRETYPLVLFSGRLASPRTLLVPDAGGQRSCHERRRDGRIGPTSRISINTFSTTVLAFSSCSACSRPASLCYAGVASRIRRRYRFMKWY